MYCQYTISCGKLRITVTNGYNPSRHQPEERWDTVMENRLDIEKTVAIIAGTVFMIMIYMYLAMETTVPGYVEIQICVAIITVLAAIYGSVAGILIPLASYIAVYVSNPRDGVKILGNGEISKKLTVKVSAFSESAKAKIEAAGFSFVRQVNGYGIYRIEDTVMD